jgi:Tfp pilus assembly protein PilF
VSLINNMLKDLESRQLREAYDQEKLLGGVKVQNADRSAPRWRLPVLAGVMVLAVLALGIWMYSRYQVASERPVSASVVVPAIKQEAEPKPKIHVNNQATLAALTSRPTAEGPQLIITLQGRAMGVVLRQAGAESSLLLKQVSRPDALSVSASVLSQFPGIDLSVENQDVRIELPLTAGETLQLSDGGNRENQQLILTRNYQPIAQPASTKPATAAVRKQPAKKTIQPKVAAITPQTPADTMPVVKQRIPPSPAEQAEQFYNRAYAALQQGNLTEAKQDLQQSIGLHPLPEAYLALAGIRVKQNDSSAARLLLDKGLQQLPGNGKLAYLYGRLLVDAGMTEKAQKVLADGLAQARRNPDYLALFAAVSRQLGHYRMAAQAYDEALKLRPKKAVWWMGLGMALDDDKQKSPALEAYYKALGLGLGDGLDTYVTKRIQELEGGQ